MEISLAMKNIYSGPYASARWRVSRRAVQPLQAAPTRVQSPLTVNEVPELRGYLGERWEANRTGSLHGFDIDKYTRLVEERHHRDWWWAGEQDGKWLESAVLSSAHSDPALREKARAILARIIASQEPDGYVGITAKDIRTPEQPLRGMDPYELYFKLHALITAYEQWGDKAALESAKKLGGYFVNTIGPGKAEFWPSDLRPPENKEKVLQGFSRIAGHSVHYGWEGTLLIDPMLRLALATGDARYTEWSKWVVDNIDKWSGWDSFSKLDKVADGTHGHPPGPAVRAFAHLPHEFPRVPAALRNHRRCHPPAQGRRGLERHRVAPDVHHRRRQRRRALRGRPRQARHRPCGGNLRHHVVAASHPIPAGTHRRRRNTPTRWRSCCGTTSSPPRPSMATPTATTPRRTG